jgi:prephenate dehydratase
MALLPGDSPQIVPCAFSAEVFEAVEAGAVKCAVLPIENSLHGAVAEHYDLLLKHDVAITGEWLLRVRHNVIAASGVRLQDVRRVLSHPVALAQCRAWLRDHPEIEAVPFYDTAGSVKHLMESGARDAAGIAPRLAAQQYGGEVLVEGIEDHSENYTRFYVLQRASPPQSLKSLGLGEPGAANKASIAFALDHRPGTLLRALEGFSAAGLNLTKIESRPVPGQPWEYVFFVDVRFEDAAVLDRSLGQVRSQTRMLKELGRYVAA